MTASADLCIFFELTGLGKEIEFFNKASSQTTPTAATYQYRVQATTNTEEALDLGDVSTETLVIIKAVDNDLSVDCDYVSATFDADLVVKESGPPAVIPNPSGIVYVRNVTTDEVCTYEYVVCGTT